MEAESRSMKIAIRADASTRIGSGHVIRCKTLAVELRRRGAELRFICRDQPGNLIPLLRDGGNAVELLPAASGTPETSGYAAWLGVTQD